MIKKSIASILIILILINGMGCYFYNQIKKEDTKRIEESDKVKITTLDEKVYVLTDVTIEGSEVKGVVGPTHSFSVWPSDIQGKEIVISFKGIKKIEVQEYNKGSSIAAIGLGIVIGGLLVFYVIVGLTYEK